MAILACIPELKGVGIPARGDSASASTESPAEPTPPVHRTATPRIEPARPASRRAREPADAFPLRSVVALVVAAAVTWSLASWQEHLRLTRQREALRLAHRQTDATGTIRP